MTQTKIGPYLRKRLRVSESDVQREWARLTLRRRRKASFVEELRIALEGIATLGGTEVGRRGHGEHRGPAGEDNEGDRKIRRDGVSRLVGRELGIPAIGPFLLGSENNRNRTSVPPPSRAGTCPRLHTAYMDHICTSRNPEDRCGPVNG